VTLAVRSRVRLYGDPLHDFDAVPKKWVTEQIAESVAESGYSEAEVDALLLAVTEEAELWAWFLSA
jgi:hypothetical protein